MLEGEILAFIGSLEGVAVLTASEEGGASEAAWGDSFFYYVPPGEEPNYQQQPFATLVCSDYPGFDVESQLDRPGIFRVNIAVGRDRFRRLLGHAAVDQQQHHADYDYARADVVVPHPVYAEQGWVSIVNPGLRTTAQVLELLAYALERATDRDKRRQRTASDSQE
jgi:RNase P protein component